MFAPRPRATRIALSLVLGSLLVLGTTGIAHAQADVHVVVSFDESKGQNPEGIAIGRTGDIYVSVSPLGDLWRIPSGSDQPQPFGHVDGIVPGRTSGSWVSRSMSSATSTERSSRRTRMRTACGDSTGRRARRRACRAPRAIGIANGLAFDKQMNLYVTDSALGAIWRIPWDGTAAIWLQATALTGDGSLGLNLGANGIAVQRRVFTVTNTERRTVLQVRKVRRRARTDLRPDDAPRR